MSELGISFDGRFYRYKEYKYDLLADALNYAKSDRIGAPDVPVANAAPLWTPPEMPTAAEQSTMDACGVTFDGKHYRYRDYRYDHYSDAINYAKLKK